MEEIKQELFFNSSEKIQSDAQTSK